MSQQLSLLDLEPMVLSPEASLAFAETILNPSGPNAALVEAFRSCWMKAREHTDADWIVYKPYDRTKPNDTFCRWCGCRP